VTKKTTFSDETDLFRASVGEVRAIQHNQVVLRPRPKPKPVPRKTDTLALDPLQNVVDDELELLYQEDSMAFLAPGVQKAVLKKLRKGRYGVHAEIDLHGLNSKEAYHYLLQSIHFCIEDGARCILIIHGKGYNSPNAQPILKNDLNFWLRQHQDVLAFCSAPARAGGTGALLVLLKLGEKFADDETSF
jgi:DNA-nicking Smr family endonuclease